MAVAFNVRALISMTGSKKASQLSHKPDVKDLVYMKELVEAGKVAPVIDRRFPLSEVAEAFRYFKEGHPSGKVVITVEHNERTEGPLSSFHSASIERNLLQIGNTTLLLSVLSGPISPRKYCL